jgi:uncharacterized membrane protein
VRDHVLDLVFLIGVALKGLDGLAELVVGVPLAFVTHGQLTAIALAVTAQELSEDPNDRVAHLILHGAAASTPGSILFAALYLIVHGVVKLAIVLALIFGAHRIYPWAIAVLSGFAVFQIVELVLHPSVSLVLLTLLDVVIIVLTWREWRQRRTLRQTLTETVAWLRSRRRQPVGSR